MLSSTKQYLHHGPIKHVFLGLGLIGYALLFSFTGCASAPQLLEDPKITFNEATKFANEAYVGTLEGCLVGKKNIRNPCLAGREA